MLSFSTRSFNNYYQEKVITDTSTLAHLNKITGLTMLGKFRKAIDNLLDATCEFTSIQAAEKVRQEITQKLGINTYVLKFQDQKIVICIPGINLSACAKKIYNLVETDSCDYTLC